MFQDDLFEFVGEYTRAIDLSDFEKAISWYQKNPNLEDVLGLLIGGQKTNFDYHKMIFDKNYALLMKS